MAAPHRFGWGANTASVMSNSNSTAQKQHHQQQHPRPHHGYFQQAVPRTGVPSIIHHGFGYGYQNPNLAGANPAGGGGSVYAPPLRAPYHAPPQAVTSHTNPRTGPPIYAPPPPRALPHNSLTLPSTTSSAPSNNYYTILIPTPTTASWQTITPSTPSSPALLQVNFKPLDRNARHAVSRMERRSGCWDHLLRSQEKWVDAVPMEEGGIKDWKPELEVHRWVDFEKLPAEVHQMWLDNIGERLREQDESCRLRRAWKERENLQRAQAGKKRSGGRVGDDEKKDTVGMVANKKRRLV
ncbi:MAG: hypothetical protein LQ346_005774 [Caloplaca aetnensis]|nr:MAG: hypothetical protein LQ346_005774 [Caloplaca aetnensis]